MARRGQPVPLAGKFDRLELSPDGTLVALDYRVLAVGNLLPTAELAADLATFLYYVPARVTLPSPRTRTSSWPR